MQCILYDPDSSPNSCIFCAYNYYDSKMEMRFLQQISPIMDQNDCILKNNETYIRNILVISPNVSFFDFSSLPIIDQVYYDLADALINEWFQFSAYTFGNFNIYLSKGDHFIKSDLLDQKYTVLFQRVQVEISLRPLNCADFNLEQICVVDETPTIFLNSIFSFGVSYSLEIHDLIIDAHDLNILNYVCSKENSSLCCDLQTYNNNSCDIKDILSNNGFEFRFFYLETAFDDPDMKFPELLLANMNFVGFQLSKQENVTFSFIVIDYFGGNLFLMNLDFSNCGLFNPIIIYNDTYFLKKDFGEFYGNLIPFLTLRNTTESFINVTDIMFLDCSASDSDKFGFLLDQSLFLFQNYQGEIMIQNVFLTNFSMNTQGYLFCLLNSTEPNNQLSNISAQNCSNVLLFFIEQSNILINQVFLMNSTWGNLAINILNCPRIYFLNLLIENSSMNVQNIDSNPLIFGSNSNINIIQSEFLNLNFLNLIFEFSTILFKNCIFHLIYTMNSPFILTNTTFIDFTQMDYFFNKQTDFDIITLIDSNFFNQSLGYSFVYSPTTLELFISSSNFINISANNTKSSQIIFVQLGLETIENSTFIDIFFSAGGNAIFTFKYSNSVVKNSIFLNCGFTYPINIANFGSIEYVNLLYFWTCNNISVLNNTFKNEGNINLFSGFIYAVLTEGNVMLEGNFFKYTNKIANVYYTGLIFSNAPNIILKNNIFYNFQCPDYVSFLHNNGAVSLQGDNTYLPLANKKNCTLINNSFFGCTCQSGGSLGIINYDFVEVNNLHFYNSSSNIGGSLLIVSSSLAFFQNVYFNQTYAMNAHTAFLKNIIEITFNKTVIWWGQSTTNGGIKNSLVGKMNFGFVMGFNLSTLGSGAVFNFNQGNSVISNSTFVLCWASETGGILLLTNNGNLNLSNIIVFQVRALYGAGIYIDSAQALEIKNSSFIKTQSKFLGSSLYINLVNNFTLESTVFLYCESLTNGIIYFQNDEFSADYSIYNISCILNSANEGSCFFCETMGQFKLKLYKFERNNNALIVSQDNLEITLELGEISNNFGNYIFFFSGISLFMTSNVFNNNSFNMELLYVDSLQTVALDNITFKNNNNLKNLNPLIFSSSSSMVLSYITMIQPSFGTYLPFLLKALGSNIEMRFSNFSNISHGSQALIDIEGNSLKCESINVSYTQGIVFNILDTDVMIENSRFYGNTIDNLTLVSDIVISITWWKKFNFSLMNCDFFTKSSFSMEISNIYSFLISNCNFIGDFGAKGVSVFDFQTLTILNSSFHNFTNLEEGESALFLSGSYLSDIPSTTFINNTIFNSNSACHSSCLFYEGLFQISIYNSTFIKNSALSNIEGKCGRVPIALFSCLSNNFNSCNVNLEENHFINNYADFMSSMIYAIASLFEKNNQVIFDSETNNIFANFISFPLYIQNCNFTISSGQPNYMIFILVDAFNQSLIYKTENTATLMKVSNSSNLILKNTLSLPTNNGTFNFSTLTIISQPNASFCIEIRTSIFEEITSRTFIISNVFDIFSRPCQIGEILTIDNQCKLCTLGQFSLIDPMFSKTQQNCKNCVPNAFCPGGSFLIPQPGFWRFSFQSTLIVSCKMEEVCLGLVSISTNDLMDNYEKYSLNEDVIHGECLNGNTGNLCDQCQKGFGKSSTSLLCVECENMLTSAYLKLFSILTLVALYAIINVMDIDQNRNSNNIITVIGKICINHVQKLAILSYFSNNAMLMNQIRNFLSFLTEFSLTNENVFSNDCFLQTVFNIENDFYIYKINATFIFPFIASIFGLFFMTFLEFWDFAKKKKHFIDKKKIYLMFLITIFLSYPIITKCSLSLVNCMKLDESDDKYLYASPNIKCWEGEHLKFFFIVGFFGILVWGIIFPIVLALLIKRNLVANYKIEGKCRNKAIICLSNFGDAASFKSKNENKKDVYLFFYKDYSKKCYYWESILFVYKFLLSLLPNLNYLVDKDKIDIYFVALVWIYLWQIIRKQPFKTKYLNSLEFFSNSLIIFSRFLAIFLDAYGNLEFWCYFCSLLFFILNILFFLKAGFLVYKYNKWKNLLRKFSNNVMMANGKFSDVFSSYFRKRGRRMMNSLRKIQFNIQKTRIVD